MSSSPSLWSLPPELYSTLSHHLSLPTLIALSQSSSIARQLLLDHLAPAYIRSFAQSPVPNPNRIINQCKWVAAIDSNFRSARMSGFSLPITQGGGGNGQVVASASTTSSYLKRGHMPVFRLWASKTGWKGLVVSHGPGMELWRVGDEAARETITRVPMRSFIETGTNAQANDDDDITSIQLASGTTCLDLVVARRSGLLQRVRVEEPRWDEWGRRWGPGRFVEVARYTTPAPQGYSTTVQSISVKDGLLITASTSRPRPHRRQRRRASTAGVTERIDLSVAVKLTRQIAHDSTAHTITIHSLASPWTSPTKLALSTKPWSTLLLGSTLVIGHSGHEPLSIVPLGATCEPIALGPPLDRPSSVYSITSPSNRSTTLNPARTIIAAYYDSTTRVYDLRAPTTRRTTLVLSDPWSDDASYSVSSGGPAGAWIAVGSARNSAIRLWDVRNASTPFDSWGGNVSPSQPEARSISKGMTMFSPSRDRSPVYEVELEFSRLWAATDRRVVGVDWDRVGPPSLVRGDDDARATKARAPVAYYRHDAAGGGGLKRSW